MIDVSINLNALASSKRDAEKAIRRLGESHARKTLIEAANAALVNALRRHFASRENEPRKTYGFPSFGQPYPKRYFWHGTHGDSLSERIRVTRADTSALEGRVSINSPALAHKLNPNPPPITPKGGRKYLAIPASPAAAAWAGMPRDFPGGLRFAYSPTPDGHFLPSLVANSKRGKNEPGEVAYWLVHKTLTRHDPNALPSHEVQASAVVSAVRAAVRRILAT